MMYRNGKTFSTGEKVMLLGYVVALIAMVTWTDAAPAVLGLYGALLVVLVAATVLGSPTKD